MGIHEDIEDRRRLEAAERAAERGSAHAHDAEIDKRGREAAIMMDRTAAMRFAPTAPKHDLHASLALAVAVDTFPDGSTWDTGSGAVTPPHKTPADPYPHRLDLRKYETASANDNKADGGGLRHDAGKTRMELLPFDGLESAAEVLTIGAEKYAPRNWERGMSWMKCVGCLMRHLAARMSGQKLDPESGKPHLAHVVVNALFLLTYELRGIGADDLAPPKVA